MRTQFPPALRRDPAPAGPVAAEAASSYEQAAPPQRDWRRLRPNTTRLHRPVPLPDYLPARMLNEFVRRWSSPTRATCATRPSSTTTRRSSACAWR